MYAPRQLDVFVHPVMDSCTNIDRRVRAKIFRLTTLGNNGRSFVWRRDAPQTTATQQQRRQRRPRRQQQRVDDDDGRRDQSDYRRAIRPGSFAMEIIRYVGRLRLCALRLCMIFRC